MEAGIRTNARSFQQCNGYGIYYGQDECTQKKNSRVSLCFVNLKFLKQPYFVI
jgi:hypothetical protein